MADVGIKLDFQGVEPVVRNLNAIGERAGDPRPAFHEIGRDFLRITGMQFSRGGAPRWAPLAASTVARKQRAHLDPAILVATGRLRASYVTDNGDHIERMTTRQVEMGTRMPHAHLHQLGTKVMPARPISVNANDRRHWIGLVRRHLLDGSPS